MVPVSLAFYLGFMATRFESGGWVWECALDSQEGVDSVLGAVWCNYRLAGMLWLCGGLVYESANIGQDLKE